MRDPRIRDLQTQYAFTVNTGGTLGGSISLFGVQYIVMAVKVRDEDGKQVAVDDPAGYLDALSEIEADFDHDGRETCKIPGYDGDWVLVITPPFRR